MNRLTHALMSILFTPVYQDQDVLICYSSQTGTAANLAIQSGDIIRQMGRNAHVSSLSSLKPSDFVAYKHVLMIVSTCGEGEIPDDGKLFYEELKSFPSISIPVSLLALGDQSYTHFCQAGKLMHEELKRMGAVKEEEPLMASGNPNNAWRSWLSLQLGQEIEKEQAKSLSTPVTLELAARKALHNTDAPGSNHAYHLTFNILDTVIGSYKVNDLIGITPHGSDKERLYSIASSSVAASNQVSLCVARHQFMFDGEVRNGRCSDYLTRQLAVGERFDAFIKVGAGMPLPREDTPVILVATGAGIAPMMSLLEERQALKHSGNNWLIFGNRYSKQDYYYQNVLDQYLEEGLLTQLNTAFSRDGEHKAYVQDKLAQHQDQLAKWLLDKEAQLYVCGRPELKPSILNTITQALETRLASRSKAKELLDSMQKDRKIFFELF